MNLPQPERPELGSGDWVILEFDGPADTTVKPCPPERLPALLAVRELYVQAGLLPPWTGPTGEKEQPSANPPDEKPE